MEELLVELNPVLIMPSDSKVSIRLFGRRYEVPLKHRENWEVPEEFVAGYTEVFYTVGSKTEQSSGAGVYLLNKNQKWAFSLGQYGTVLQAEVRATLTAAIDERMSE